MRFAKILAVTLILTLTFVFFGGWKLFDLHGGVYLTAAVWALIAAAVINAFAAQEQRIEALEKRVKELERQRDREEK